MKILGISFGRAMQCSEIMVKEALFKAKEAGADVQFIRTVNMDIGHCRGCGACGQKREAGEQVNCVFKDDYQKLEELVLDADGIIIAAPVFAVGTTGQFKNFLDRFCPSHDRAALMEDQKRRIAAGKTGNELLDARYFKDRYVGYISVGGAVTQNWVAFGLPTMHLFEFSCQMKVVGHIDAYDQGRRANPLLDKELMRQCGELGKRIAEAIGKPYGEVEWYGEEGTCPVCHCNLMTMNGTTNVECPICGITGKLSVEGDRVNVSFSQEQKNRARSTLAGVYEHYNEIQGMIPINIEKQKKYGDVLKVKLEKYKNFGEFITE